MSNPETSFKKSVIDGMTWAVLSAVAVKSMGFISQIFLGWLLSKGDFGIYAIAISVSSLVVPMQNGGVHKILTQRCHEYDTLAPGLFKLALVFNIIFAGFLLALMPVSAKLYDVSELPLMLAIIALSLPLRTPGAILRARLLSDLKFNKSAKISTISSLVRNCSTILFAFAGLGPMSFVLPLLVVAVFDNFAYWYVVREWPWGGRLTWKFFRDIFRDAKWVMFGTLVLHLSLQGDYLVIGLFEDKSVVGVYFFAFQLSIAFSVLFAAGIDSVMMPSFSRMSGQPDRQKSAFIQSFSILSFYIAPVAVLGALFVEPVIHFIWAGKWDVATVATQVLLISLMARLPLSLTLSFLESTGRWKLRACIQAIDTVGVMISAAVGAWLGGVVAIALFVSVYRFVAGLIFSLVGFEFSGVSKMIVVRSNMEISFFTIFIGLLSLFISNELLFNDVIFVKYVVRFFIFSVLLSIYYLLFHKKRVVEIYSYAKFFTKKI